MRTLCNNSFIISRCVEEIIIIKKHLKKKKNNYNTSRCIGTDRTEFHK